MFCQMTQYGRKFYFGDFAKISFIIKTIPQDVSKIPKSTLKSICGTLLFALHCLDGGYVV